MKTLKLAYLIVLTSAVFAQSSDTGVSISQDVLTLFQRGNQAYQAGNFEESTAFFNRVLEAGAESAELYFNLGNARFKAGDNTHAILYYEKALKLNPEDEDIRTNLEIANLKTVDKVEARPQLMLSVWWQEALNIHTVDEWAALSVYLIFIALVVMLLFLFTRGMARRISFFAGMTVVAASLCCIFLGSRLQAFQTSNEYAIVTASTVTVKSSPEADGTKLFVIHEGTKIRCLDEVGEWTEVALMNGNKGWVRTEVFEPI